MEKDAAFLEEINYFVTCHLIFPTISHIYVVKRVNLLTLIQLPLPLLVFFGIKNTKFLKRYSRIICSVFCRVPQKLHVETHEEFPVCLTCLSVLTQ